MSWIERETRLIADRDWVFLSTAGRFMITVQVSTTKSSYHCKFRSYIKNTSNLKWLCIRCVYIKYWRSRYSYSQTNHFSRETEIEIQRKYCTTSRTCYKCASMISRQDRLLYFPRFTKTCSTVSSGYDRHNSAMRSVSGEKVWRHRRVTLTKSRPSGSIAIRAKETRQESFFLTSLWGKTMFNS